MVNLTTEEAIKELSRYTDQEFYTPQNREAHRMAIETLGRSRWIPVTERLPEDERIAYQNKYNTDEPVGVLVMIEGASEPTELLYAGDNVFCDYYDGEVLYYSVTNWMPLPEPPKEG